MIRPKVALVCDANGCGKPAMWHFTWRAENAPVQESMRNCAECSIKVLNTLVRTRGEGYTKFVAQFITPVKSQAGKPPTMGAELEKLLDDPDK